MFEFDNDYIATKGDIKNHNKKLSREISDVRSEISNLHHNLSLNLQQIQFENSQRMNELSKRLNEQNKQFEEIQKKLEKPIATKTNELRQRAIESLNNGWLEEAKEDILEVLKLDKTDYIAHLILARIYLMLDKDLNSALEHYDFAIKYSGPYDKEFQKSVGIEKAEMFLNIARQFKEQDNLEEAVKYYDIALNILLEVKAYDEYVKITIEKALMYYNKGLFDNALKEMENIENNFSNFDPEVYYYKALFLVNLEKKDEAFEYIKKYILNTLNTKKVLNTKDFKPLKERIEAFIKETIDPKLQEFQQLETKIKDRLQKIEEIKKLYLSKENFDLNEASNKLSENEKKIIKIINEFIYIVNEFNNIKKTNFNNYNELVQSIEALNNLNEKINSLKEEFLKAFDTGNILSALIVSIIIGIIGGGVIFIFFVFPFIEHFYSKDYFIVASIVLILSFLVQVMNIDEKKRLKDQLQNT